jgi:hypothetical protein
MKAINRILKTIKIPFKFIYNKQYEDLVGNSHTNIGPIFGESVVTDNSAPTTSSTINDVDSEL